MVDAGRMERSLFSCYLCFVGAAENRKSVVNEQTKEIPLLECLIKEQCRYMIVHQKR